MRRFEIIGKSPHSWPKIVIHGNSCIILYLVIYLSYIKRNAKEWICIFLIINMIEQNALQIKITGLKSSDIYMQNQNKFFCIITDSLFSMKKIKGFSMKTIKGSCISSRTLVLVISYLSNIQTIGQLKCLPYWQWLTDITVIEQWHLVWDFESPVAPFTKMV